MTLLQKLTFCRNAINILKNCNYSASSKSRGQTGHEGINLKIGSNPTDTKEVRVFRQFKIQV